MTGRGPTDQELALRDRVVRDFWGRSAFHRGRMQRAGLTKHGLRSSGDMRRLPPMRLSDVDSSTELLSFPQADGRQRRQYWPLQWVMAGKLPVAYSADDLALLGSLGRDLLEAAGAGSTDVLANVLPPNANRDQLQMLLGAQVAGLSSVILGANPSLDQLEAIAPTVLVGEVKELNRVFDLVSAASSALLEEVHTIIVTGTRPAPRIWKKFLDHLGEDDPRVVRAWAPDGAFAMWVQCRGGEGFHTWPSVELLEIMDPSTELPVPEGMPGSVVWTGLEWYATSMLRLDTEVSASLLTETCPDCGRETPRLLPRQKAAGFSAVLDANPNVQQWFAELRRTSHDDELVIWVALHDAAGSLHVLADVDAKIGDAQVQVVDVTDVKRLREEANGESFGDRRAVRLL